MEEIEKPEAVKELTQEEKEVQFALKKIEKCVRLEKEVAETKTISIYRSLSEGAIKELSKTLTVTVFKEPKEGVYLTVSW